MKLSQSSLWRTIALASLFVHHDAAVAAPAADAAAAAETFRTEVAPLLATKCGACHAAGSSESGFRIDEREKTIAGGDTGTVGIVPGKPDDSELYKRIVTDDHESRMPADGEPLSADEQQLVRLKEGKDRSANGTSASVGLAGRIMRSNRRSWLGRTRPDRGGAAELPIHAQGRIFLVGADRP